MPIIIGNAAGDVRRIFADKADSMHAPITFAQDKLPFDSAAVMQDCIEYRGTEWGDIRGQLSGDCQKENGATILTALVQLSQHFTRIDTDAVKIGLGDVCGITGLHGSLDDIMHTPCKSNLRHRHNIGGWRWLAPKLKSLADTSRLAMVIGFVNDKDVEAIMQLMPSNASYFFATPSVKRGRPAEETASIAAASRIARLILRFGKRSLRQRLHSTMPLRYCFCRRQHLCGGRLADRIRHPFLTMV